MGDVRVCREAKDCFSIPISKSLDSRFIRYILFRAHNLVVVMSFFAATFLVVNLLFTPIISGKFIESLFIYNTLQSKPNRKTIFRCKESAFAFCVKMNWSQVWSGRHAKVWYCLQFSRTINVMFNFCRCHYGVATTPTLSFDKLGWWPKFRDYSKCIRCHFHSSVLILIEFIKTCTPLKSVIKKTNFMHNLY